MGDGHPYPRQNTQSKQSKTTNYYKNNNGHESEDEDQDDHEHEGEHDSESGREREHAHSSSSLLHSSLLSGPGADAPGSNTLTPPTTHSPPRGSSIELGHRIPNPNPILCDRRVGDSTAVTDPPRRGHPFHLGWGKKGGKGGSRSARSQMRHRTQVDLKPSRGGAKEGPGSRTSGWRGVRKVPMKELAGVRRLSEGHFGETYVAVWRRGRRSTLRGRVRVTYTRTHALTQGVVVFLYI